MRMTRCIWALLLTAALAASCMAPPKTDRKVQKLLDELDGFLATRELYVAKKSDQLSAYRRLISATLDPASRYELAMMAASDYFPFSFDSTQVYLKNAQSLALQIRDHDRYDQASIALGHLYAKAGNYYEASQILYSQIDTAALSVPMMEEYLWVLYDFSKDMAGNSGMVERYSIPPAAPFRTRLLTLLPHESPRYRALLRDQLMDEGHLDQADSVSRLLLASVKPENRDFAIHAFFQSELENMFDHQYERMYWLVKSAEGDVVNAVRDYASLTMVAQLILPTDVLPVRDGSAIDGAQLVLSKGIHGIVLVGEEDEPFPSDGTFDDVFYQTGVLFFLPDQISVRGRVDPKDEVAAIAVEEFVDGSYRVGVMKGPALRV